MWPGHLWKGYLTCLLIFILYGILPSRTQSTSTEVIHDGGLKKDSTEAGGDAAEPNNATNNPSDSPKSQKLPKVRSNDTSTTTLPSKITTTTTAFISRTVQVEETSAVPAESTTSSTAGRTKPKTSKRTEPYAVTTEKDGKSSDSTTQSTALPLTVVAEPTGGESKRAGLSPIMMGIIGGVAVGLILIIIVIILIVLYFVKRRRRSSKHDILMVENPQYRGPLAPPKPPRTANKYRFSRDSELYVDGVEGDGEEHKVTPRKKRRAPPPPPVVLGPDGRPPIPSRTYSSRSSADPMPMTTFARKSSAPLAEDDDDVFEADSSQDEGNEPEDVSETGTRDPLLKNDNKHSEQNGNIKEKDQDSKQDSQKQNNLKNSDSKSSLNWDDYDKENNPFFPG